MKKRLFAILLAFSLALCLAACASSTPSNDPSTSPSTSGPSNSGPETSDKPVEISVAFKWMASGLDSCELDSGYVRSVCYHIFDRLVVFDDMDNSMSPGIAKSWKQIDNLTWEFDINLVDYVFQNGDKLTMDDIIYSIERLKDIPRSADTGAKVENVTYKDSTLSIKFTEENNSLMTMVLSTAIIVNKAHIEAGGDDARLLKPIGTGPYKVTDFVPATSLVLETWDGYLLPKPQIDKITFIISPEDAARYIAVETGQVQYSAWFTPFEMNLAEANDKLSTYYGESRRFHCLTFNCEKAPFDNVNVRKALSYAIDRDSLSALQGGGRPPWRGVLFAGYPMYVEPANLPEFDLQKAKDLLAAEGYSESNSLKFSMLTYAPADPALELYQSVLKSIGVNMEINEVEVSMQNVLRAAGDFEVEWWTPSNRGNHWLVDLERFDDNYFGSRNTSRYSNARVQEIVKRMRVTTDQKELDELNAEINKILADELPMVAVIDETNMAAFDKRLTGVTLSPDTCYNFRNAVFAE